MPRFPLDDLSTEEADELGPAHAVEVHLQIQGDQLIQLCATQQVISIRGSLT
jgi:hypothetical protein